MRAATLSASTCLPNYPSSSSSSFSSTSRARRRHTQVIREWRPTEAVLLLLLLQRRRCRAPSRRTRGITSPCARRTGGYGSGTPTRARSTASTCLPRTSAPLVLASPGDHAERPRYAAVSQTAPRSLTRAHFNPP